MNPKLKPGLVSISFRDLSCEEIVKLVSESRLSGIEMGGDVHVPHGNLPTAERAAKMTLDAGLEVSRILVPIIDLKIAILRRARRDLNSNRCWIRRRLLERRQFGSGLDKAVRKILLTLGEKR